MPSGQALNTLFRMVRDFADQAQPWQTAVRYQTLPDERYDITKVSARVYGTLSNTLVIQAAAGLDSPEQPLTERLLVLPTAAQLRTMKLKAGFDASEIL
jgi:hypothetical protein